ncbi:MAG: glycosyltransferase family 2 protein [Dehalococcoidia bacterium]
MADHPLVSVITPTHNRAGLIGRAIKSVQNQTHQDWEHIIIDDASTDDTEAVVRAFQESDDRIVYIKHPENRNGAAARNTGIRAAKGDYVAFLDSDDEFHPETLAKQLAVFESSDLENLGLVTCGRREVGPGGSEAIKLPKRRGWVRQDVLGTAPRTGNIGIVHIGFMMKRNSEPIMFDERLAAFQDWDFLARATAKYQLDYVPEPLLIVNVQGERVHSAKNVASASEILIEKHSQETPPDGNLLQREHLRAAGAYFEIGLKRKSLRHVWSGIKTNPKAWRHYHRLALSAFGLDPTLSLGVMVRMPLHRLLRTPAPSTK